MRLVAACEQAQGAAAACRTGAGESAGSEIDAKPAPGDGERLAAEAADLIRFFDYVIAQHHADEEEDLFPALIESMAGSDAVCLKEMTGALRSEHRLLEADWRELRAELARVAEAARAAESGASPGAVAVMADTAKAAAPPRSLAEESATSALQRSARRFTDRLHAHSVREDSELLPMAERLLSDEELAAIAEAMQRRRAQGAGSRGA